MSGVGHSGALSSTKTEIHFSQVSSLVLPQSVTLHLHSDTLSKLSHTHTELHVQDGAHDSAEDAKTALQLYRVYQRLQHDQRLQESLGKMYDAGRKLNWQVPYSS